MCEYPTAADWAGERGEKWRAHSGGMEATLAPIDEPLFDALRLDAPVRLAEVGSGAGGTAIALLRRAPLGSVVHGFDISPSLVELARERGRGEPALAFHVADMQTAVPEAPYDRLYSRFGVMFFSQPQSAFTNLARWLAPGGRLAFAVWGPEANNPWFATTREAVASVVDAPAPEPDAPGPFRYADADKLVTLLGAAGLRSIEVNDWRGVLPIGGGLSAPQASAFALSSFAAFAALLAKAGEAAADSARVELARRLAPFERDGVVRLDAVVHIVTGVRG